MQSCYDISYLNEKASGGEVFAKIRIFKGDYEDVTTDEGTVNQFVRKKLLAEPEILFDYFSVPANDLQEAFKSIVADYSKLPLIREQQANGI